MIFINNFVDSTNFYPAKSAATLQPDRIKPEFGNLIIALNMDMLKLILISCIKENRYDLTLKTVGILFL